MRFPGYWAAENEGLIEVRAAEFDDTDLSDYSDWKEAWQNEDPDFAHGFVDPLTMLHSVSKKVVGEMDATVLEAAAAKFRDGVPLPVNDLQDLAMLIQLLIPEALPQPRQNPRLPLVTDDEADDPPF
jgi:hypothetical protein